MRQATWFMSGDTRCAAYLYTPAHATASLPCVVMGHGFSATQAGVIANYASGLAAAGFAVVTFDYRGFGESEGTQRQVVDIRAQLEDWRAAIAFARSLPQVAKERIALWGSSLGGGHVLKHCGRRFFHCGGRLSGAVRGYWPQG